MKNAQKIPKTKQKGRKVRRQNVHISTVATQQWHFVYKVYFTLPTYALKNIFDQNRLYQFRIDKLYLLFGRENHCFSTF
jgi:hypothetical protein